MTTKTLAELLLRVSDIENKIQALQQAVMPQGEHIDSLVAKLCELEKQQAELKAMVTAHLSNIQSKFEVMREAQDTLVDRLDKVEQKLYTKPNLI